MSLLAMLAALFRRAPRYKAPEGVFPNPAENAGLTEADLLRAAMDKGGITDNDTRAGIAAICMGESAMKGYTERGYSNTSNDRIRQVFGSRMSGMTDGAISVLKADDRAFFNYVYGPHFAIGRQLGNTQPSDGYKFRGRGFIQLTGRGNYERYGAAIGRRADLLTEPDLANDPVIAAELAVAYIKDRYHGGGWDALVRCVGNNTPDIRAKKDDYFRRFKSSGEFNV